VYQFEIGPRDGASWLDRLAVCSHRPHMLLGKQYTIEGAAPDEDGAAKSDRQEGRDKALAKRSE
jgi:hypothetical protein